ncbi:MAG TPA: sorbosone dehydrogenase family protein [Flavobacterium sp.]|nr:sorbosone dehydrogenase family protein [Flavobacterium sp.]
MKKIFPAILLLATISFASCKDTVKQEEKEILAQQPGNIVKTAIGDITLPAPYATKSVSKRNNIIDWPAGQMPTAPAGFTVTKFADSMKGPRNAYVGPNNDVFVCESEANQITVFRDKNNDGTFETRNIFLSNLDKPFGMLILKNYFYVANTDGVYRFPYNGAPLKLTVKGEKILDLPHGGRHWTRNLLANANGSKIYVAVGSSSNVAEDGIDHEMRRANILEINPDGTAERIYGSGLRNPVGMDWNPVNNELWTAVNERDELGDDLVPDYITSVKPGGFYGWPYSYFGKNLDPRLNGEGKDLSEKAIVPDVPVGSHTATLGLAFYNKDAFPAKYKNGVFAGQHGSWNRSVITGYKVIFVPFSNGKPSGKPEDFLTGFIANANNFDVYGRPVGVTVMNDGSLLVCDDGSGNVWRVSANK